MRTTDATALTLHGKSVVALRAKLPLLAAGAPESWVEMAYVSAWKGHHQGEFEFTRETLDAIVARFDLDENPLPVTYEHPDTSTGQPIPAAGWIREMQVRDGETLWGRIEWTARAADLIRAGEYRYCSVVVDWAPIDRASGEPSGIAEMYALGLTNTPFLPGMQAITLSRVGAPARLTQRNLSMDPTKTLETIAKALGMDAKSTVEAIKARFDAMAAYVAAIKEEPIATVEGLAKDEAALSRFCASATKALASVKRVHALADEFVETPAAEDTETAGAMAIGKLVTATGLDEAAVLAGLDANLDAIAALITGAPASGMSSDAGAAAATLSREVDSSRIVELTARASKAETRLVELEADLAKRTAVETQARIVANFERLKTEGRVGESQRAKFLELSAKHEAPTLAAYEDHPAILPPAGQVATGAAAAPPVALGKGNAPVDPTLAPYLDIAQSEGLRGAKRDARARVLLSNAARLTPTNTDA